MAVWLRYLIKGLISLIIIITILVYFSLKSNLPHLNGEFISQTQSPVKIDRDSQGIATIQASSQLDASYALGWLHAQERFFQMDLLRRNSAGELSELFGPVALSHDKRIRIHQFRKRAKQRFQTIPESQKAIITAYTQGVNQGLEALTTPPYEYLLLTSKPKKWAEADTFLVLFSMFMDLQDEFGQREQLLGHLKEHVMGDVFAFLNPKGSIWDSAIDGTRFRESSIPRHGFEPAPIIDQVPSQEMLQSSETHEGLPGSNSWVVNGKLTTGDGALLANDMHLGIGVPNIWYRASLNYPLQSVAEEITNISLHGVTLPGTPALIVGSNTLIAWGFTNSYGDWSDVVKIELGNAANSYLTNDGEQQFVVDFETIMVKGAPTEQVEIKKTIWGPIINPNEPATPKAIRWVAHDDHGVNFNLLNLAHAKSAKEALSIAPTLGIPAQNIVVADAKGNIGWTIAGAIPNRKAPGFSQLDWQVPHYWFKHDVTWQGYVPAAQYPVVYNPSSNRIWTGNSRVVGDEAYEIIGNGGYALGARSQQIQKNLEAREQFSELDMLSIQNDHKAVFLSRWHRFIMDKVLPNVALPEDELKQIKNYLIQWQQAASVDSVGYTIVRQYRLNLRDKAFEKLTRDSNIQPNKVKSLRLIRHQLETPLWSMVTEQPLHLLNDKYDTYTDMFTSVFIDTTRQLEDKYGTLSNATWGNVNKTKIEHPLARAIPLLGPLLNMPEYSATGDSYMPRVQGVRFGSSQRLVVMPGQESRGIMHMPSGQASHPFSPYFGSGHKDWIDGTPSPLLPGKTEYSLTLVPEHKLALESKN